MRIGLVGAGPVGSLLALSLLYNGLPFSWVVRSPDRREQLDKLRFSIGGRGAELPISSLPMPESSGELAALDWCIFAVKAHEVSQALSEAGLMGRTRTLVVANGLQRGPFHLALLYGGAYLDPAGRLIAGVENELVLGNLGMQASSVEELLGPLSTPFLNLRPDDHMQIRMWHKLTLNCVINPLTAIHDCLNGDILKHVEESLLQALIAEVDAVAEADCAVQTWTTDRWRDKWFGNGPETLLHDLHRLIETTAANSSSMREDLRAGRETEIAALNGAVSALGAAYGIPCPINAALTKQLLSLQRDCASARQA